MKDERKHIIGNTWFSHGPNIGGKKHVDVVVELDGDGCVTSVRKPTLDELYDYCK